jgi:hypothetical protein
MLASAWGGTELLCPSGWVLYAADGRRRSRHSVGSSVRNCLPRNCKTSHGPQRTLYGRLLLCGNSMQKLPLQFSRQKLCSVLLLTLESDVAEQTNFSWTSLASSIKLDWRFNAISHAAFEDRFLHGCLSKIVTRIAIAVYMYNKIVDSRTISVFVCL